MRVLLYEFLTSGGWAATGWGPPPASLLREGSAMATSVAADLAAIPGVEVVVLRDQDRQDLDFPHCRVVPVADGSEERHRLRLWAAESDWTIVIAPEFSGFLAQRCRWVQEAGGRLLGPRLPLVELAADKHRTAEHLRANGVPTPDGIALEPGETLPASFAYPAILKPRDGAGSQDVRLIRAPPTASDGALTLPMAARLERYCAGLAASVAWLCGPAGNMALAPCRQWLADDGSFAYLGGSLPLPERLAARATELAGKAVAALPDPFGYLGIDLVLGDAPDGSLDFVIEVNPRFTTSYVGLRRAADNNLAAALLEVATGRTPTLSFRKGPVEFRADGTVGTGPR